MRKLLHHEIIHQHTHFNFRCIRRKPAFPHSKARNINIFGVSREKIAFKRNNASYSPGFFGRVMRKPAFSRINASIIRVFGAS